MAERDNEQPENFEHETSLPYASTPRAYLLTLYDSKEKKGASFVTVQASHSNESHRFIDLASAFSYLLSVTQLARRESKKPDP